METLGYCEVIEGELPEVRHKIQTQGGGVQHTQRTEAAERSLKYVLLENSYVALLS